jgi:hypothetical protein
MGPRPGWLVPKLLNPCRGIFAVTQMAITTRRHSDATIARHVAILERVAACHNGVLPPYKWLNENGYFASYDVSKQYPAAFAHIKTSTDKKFEIYQAKETAISKGVGEILPPAKYGSLAEYHVPGATFHPTDLHIESGIPEGDWMQIGRALAAVCQSTYWWVGDWIQYGFKTFGKQTTFDLAQQATGYARAQLYDCAYIAKRFPPERRVEALTFFHHRSVAKFPPAVADKVLAESVELGLTGRQAKDAAIEETGGPTKPAPHHPLQLKKVTVRLYGPTFDKLKARCVSQTVDSLIGQIVEQWIAIKEKAGK